ncbi:MAG: type II toxin-antitoxin system RelE/ParE family toxin [Elusimicrobia bacterium]|nr:type II toxin-antitoxin system RelE/ParE family toxin [Elusimicrobiota bacterium]
MADYRIFETASFLEDIAAAPASLRERLRAKLTGYVYPFLRRSRGHSQARMLRNYQPETWRWRIGDWRAFYLVDDEARVVSMLALSLRRDAYKK